MGLYLFIRRAIKHIVVIIEAYQFVNYIQNFIQHPAVKVNSIHKGNHWGSSIWISMHQVNYWSYIMRLSNTWKKNGKYNETVHQLFIDFKKAYDSVMREVLYIFIEFGIPMTLVRI
jgi:hypothetical protein